MKKINFSDKYGLTEAVLSGRKTQTRRIIPQSVIQKASEYQLQYLDATLDAISEREAIEQIYFVERLAKLPYQIGEVVAVAQSYKDAGVDFIPEEDEEFGCYNFPAEQTYGWTNKLYVKSSLMPLQIRITNVRVERLQDISDEDCEKEGVYVFDEDPMNPQAFVWTFHNTPMAYYTPREAYAALIDRISGRGTWERNPYVFVYDFELIK